MQKHQRTLASEKSDDPIESIVEETYCAALGIKKVQGFGKGKTAIHSGIAKALSLQCAIFYNEIIRIFFQDNPGAVYEDLQVGVVANSELMRMLGLSTKEMEAGFDYAKVQYGEKSEVNNVQKIETEQREDQGDEG